MGTGWLSTSTTATDLNIERQVQARSSGPRPAAAVEVSADGELRPRRAMTRPSASGTRSRPLRRDVEEEASPISAIGSAPMERAWPRAESGRTRLWSLSTSHEGTRVAVVAESLWDLPPVPPPSAGITAGPVFLPDGRLVAFGHSDGSISLHSVANGQVAQTLKAKGSAPVSALAVRSDVPCLASAETQGISTLELLGRSQ